MLLSSRRHKTAYSTSDDTQKSQTLLHNKTRIMHYVLKLIWPSKACSNQNTLVNLTVNGRVGDGHVKTWVLQLHCSHGYLLTPTEKLVSIPSESKPFEGSWRYVLWGWCLQLYSISNTPPPELYWDQAVSFCASPSWRPPDHRGSVSSKYAKGIWFSCSIASAPEIAMLLIVLSTKGGVWDKERDGR